MNLLTVHWWTWLAFLLLLLSGGLEYGKKQQVSLIGKRTAFFVAACIAMVEGAQFFILTCPVFWV